jgi:hypothetical protein
VHLIHFSVVLVTGERILYSTEYRYKIENGFLKIRKNGERANMICMTSVRMVLFYKNGKVV